MTSTHPILLPPAHEVNLESNNGEDSLNFWFEEAPKADLYADATNHKTATTNGKEMETRESPEGCSTCDQGTTAESESFWTTCGIYEGKSCLNEDTSTSGLNVLGPENSDFGVPGSVTVETMPEVQTSKQKNDTVEVFYDNVPTESYQRPSLSVEDVYEDINTSDYYDNSIQLLDRPNTGWSSDEFESYEEFSDGEATLSSQHSSKVDLLSLKERCTNTGRDLALRLSSPNVTNIKNSCDTKVQQLIKAARTGTRDSLEKTRLAMMRKMLFLQNKDSTGEGMDDVSYMDVSVCELKHPPAQLCPMPEGLTSQQVVRRLILTSILQSEISYLNSLRRILQEYEKPLAAILNQKKVRQMFFRVKEIYQCHSMFQIALASRVVDWDQSEKIGDLFVASFSKSMVLSVYSDYINNFTNAMLLIKKACMTKTAFLEFLKKKQASSPDRITLYGLMVKPIQRFPQFILLLQDMLSNTGKCHGDRLPLQLALSELETLTRRLNEQKRVAEQQAEIQQLARSVGGLSKLLNLEQKQLIQCEQLTEIVYGDKGQVLKSKERKVFLLDDTLICANINLKGPLDVSSLVPVGHKYSIKWSFPLSQVQVVEAGQDSLQSKDALFAARGFDKVFVGSPRLYEELEDLQHDLGVVEQVSVLVGTIKGVYQNLNSTVCQDWCLALQRLIRLKEEEIQNANKCCLCLSVPGKPDRSGRPVSVMVVFNTPSPFSKISWLNRLHLAKMAQSKENSSGWESVEDDGKMDAVSEFPMLTCSLPAPSSMRMKTALHSPSTSSVLGPCSVSTCLPQGYLWVAGGGPSNLGQIQMFSLNRSTPRLVKTLPVKSAVLCLERLRNASASRRDDVEHEVTLGNIMSVGLQDGSILVFSCVDTTLQCLQTLVTSDLSPVLCLRHSVDVLFAGLGNGKLAVFHRQAGETLWNTESCQLLPVGSEPVQSLLMLEDSVWAGCSNHVTVIQKTSQQMQSFQAHPDSSCKVSIMVRSGGGVWMAFSQTSSIHLFHTETLELLQDVNISTRSHHLSPGAVWISSLLVWQGLLWVGTNQGVILTFPVPSLEGIPKITRRGTTSLNAHCGPVDFLVPASSFLAPDFHRRGRRSIGEQGADGGGGERRSSQGLLLRYRLSSTSLLPGKPLGEQAVDQALQELQEHRPEDGSIYELTEEPDVWVRGRIPEGRKETKRNFITSSAIFSGGQGHRRTDRRGSTASSENTLLVWQPPLTLQ